LTAAALIAVALVFGVRTTRGLEWADLIDPGGKGVIVPWPMHVVAAQIGTYANLLAPVCFFWMAKSAPPNLDLVFSTGTRRVYRVRQAGA
jgi:hypothetical protein